MESSNPKALAFIISLILSGLTFVLFLLMAHLFNFSNAFVPAVITSVVLLIIAFLVISLAINRFLYSRIKLIYKSISSLKIRKNDKVNLSRPGEMLEDVNAQFVSWAQNQQLEMDKLREQEQFRSEFLGNLSHELKTPIFSIQGYILTLLEGGLEDPKINRDFLERAANGVERMTHIIEDLDTITKLESEKIQLHITKVNLIDLCVEIMESFELKAKEKNIRLNFNRNYDKPIFVLCDKGRIGQVLTNLIANSINYGKEEGKTELRFFDMDNKILVEVADDGLGIAQEHLPRLFERFYRVDKSRARHQGGSGLGLAIVKHILEAHTQTINVRSAENEGSTFSFTLNKAK